MKTKIDCNSKSYENQIIKNWEQCIIVYCKENNYTYSQQKQCTLALEYFLKYIDRLNRKIAKKTGLKEALKVSSVLFFSIDQFIYILLKQEYIKLFSESFLRIQKESVFSRAKNYVEPKFIFCLEDILSNPNF